MWWIAMYIVMAIIFGQAMAPRCPASKRQAVFVCILAGVLWPVMLLVLVWSMVLVILDAIRKDVLKDVRRRANVRSRKPE